MKAFEVIVQFSSYEEKYLVFCEYLSNVHYLIQKELDGRYISWDITSVTDISRNYTSVVTQEYARD